MSAFKWSEIKKWAAVHEIKPKKVGSEYQLDDKTYKNIDDLVQAVFNKITNDKFIDHQKQYDAAQI